MEPIIGKRGSGKTTKLIIESAETGEYIVVANGREAQEVSRMAKEMNFKIPFPLTYRELICKNYYRGGVKGLLLDNVERFLEYVSDGLITTFTLRYEEQDFEIKNIKE